MLENDIGECLVDDVTGLEYNGMTGVISLTTGYLIPKTWNCIVHIAVLTDDYDVGQVAHRTTDESLWIKVS